MQFPSCAKRFRPPYIGIPPYWGPPAVLQIIQQRKPGYSDQTHGKCEVLMLSTVYGTAQKVPSTNKDRVVRLGFAMIMFQFGEVKYITSIQAARVASNGRCSKRQFYWSFFPPGGHAWHFSNGRHPSSEKRIWGVIFKARVRRLRLKRKSKDSGLRYRDTVRVFCTGATLY